MCKAVVVLLLLVGLVSADPAQHHRKLSGILGAQRTLSNDPNSDPLRLDGIGSAGAKMAELLRNINSLARGEDVSALFNIDFSTRNHG